MSYSALRDANEPLAFRLYRKIEDYQVFAEEARPG